MLNWDDYGKEEKATPAIIENRFDTIPNTTATFASIAQNLAPLYLSADLQIPTTV